jgi:hypothetical protein
VFLRSSCEPNPAVFNVTEVHEERRPRRRGDRP